MPRVVMLGTGTGVGKTFVSSALIRVLASRGLPVQGLKPVETGIEPLPRGPDPAPPPGTDAHRLEESAIGGRHPAPPRPHPLYSYAPPISPHLAAEQSGRSIDITHIRAWTDAALRDAALRDVWQVVETAGGALSPVSTSQTNVDIARALGPTLVVLVAPDNLGVLHDLRATLTALGVEGCRPDCVVLSAARAPDASTSTHVREIPRVGLPAPVAVLERDDPAGAEALADALIALAARAPS